MPSPITQEAIDIINAAPSCGPLHPAEYTSALTQNATGLARILGKEEIITAATAYHEADGRAVRSQARFVLMGCRIPTRGDQDALSMPPREVWTSGRSAA